MTILSWVLAVVLLASHFRDWYLFINILAIMTMATYAVMTYLVIGAALLSWIFGDDWMLHRIKTHGSRESISAITTTMATMISCTIFMWSGWFPVVLTVFLFYISLTTVYVYGMVRKNLK